MSWEVLLVVCCVNNLLRDVTLIWSGVCDLSVACHTCLPTFHWIFLREGTLLICINYYISRIWHWDLRAPKHWCLASLLYHEESSEKNNRKELEAVGQCIPPARHVLPVSQCGYGSPPKFSHLFIGPLPTFAENFMQIRLEVFFCPKLLTDRQRRLHILLGGAK